MGRRYICFVAVIIMCLTSLNENSHAQDRPSIIAFAISPDERYLAVSYYSQPRTVEIIETQTRKIVWSYSLQNAINPKPAWSPNSQYIALFDINSIEVVEITTSEEKKSFQNQLDNYVFAVSWSPDSKFIAVATSSSIGLAEETYIKVWDVETLGLVKNILEGLVEPSEITWSPDGVNLGVSGFERPTFVLNVQTGNNDLYLENGHAFSADWNPDGKRIATGELKGQACIWDAQSGELLNAFETGYDSYAQVKWSPDGTKLLMALEENRPAWVWYVAENRALLIEDFTSNGVLQVWSADSTQLVYEDNGEIQFLQLPPANEAPLIEPPNDGNGCIEEWNPDSL